MLWRHADVINNETRYENSHMTCRDVSHIIVNNMANWLQMNNE